MVELNFNVFIRDDDTQKASSTAIANLPHILRFLFSLNALLQRRCISSIEPAAQYVKTALAGRKVNDKIRLHRFRCITPVEMTVSRTVCQDAKRYIAADPRSPNLRSLYSFLANKYFINWHDQIPGKFSLRPFHALTSGEQSLPYE